MQQKKWRRTWQWPLAFLSYCLVFNQIGTCGSGEPVMGSYSSIHYMNTGWQRFLESPRCDFKPCSHVTFAFSLNVTNGVYGNKWWCSHLLFTLLRTGQQRSKKNANADVMCECTFSLQLWIWRNEPSRPFLPPEYQFHQCQFNTIVWWICRQFTLRMLAFSCVWSQQVLWCRGDPQV